jgi:dihydroorotase-like cyclic amidohydrolase
MWKAPLRRAQDRKSSRPAQSPEQNSIRLTIMVSPAACAGATGAPAHIQRSTTKQTASTSATARSPGDAIKGLG